MSQYVPLVLFLGILAGVIVYFVQHFDIISSGFFFGPHERPFPAQDQKLSPPYTIEEPRVYNESEVSPQGVGY